MVNFFLISVGTGETSGTGGTSGSASRTGDYGTGGT